MRCRRTDGMGRDRRAARLLETDNRREFREALDGLVRFYGFLSRALPWIPPNTDVLYLFSKVLLARLRGESADGGVDISGTAEHPLPPQRARHQAISMSGAAHPLSAITCDGSGADTGPGQIAMSMLTEPACACSL